ncbi:MAG: hypothetical protein DMG12_09155 [Acidobacteria bacterium]|nr:MAG: hypothetical protein DMG12_09155 [Acidobacteriota bacterium]
MKRPLSLRRVFRILPSIAILVLASAPVHAQWVKVPAAGIPRGTDGKPNLSAPRAADGHPDLSGVWEADPFANCLPQGVPRRISFEEALNCDLENRPAVEGDGQRL